MRHCSPTTKILLAIAWVAFMVCFFSNHVWHSMNAQDAHHNLHEQLKITSQQDKKLEPIEQRFLTRKTELEATIKEANAKLGKAIMEDKAYSPRVKAAVEDIHHAQGELQKATLEHLFDMQSVLTPEQSEKLNRMAADALIHNK
jgi:Spy/CpxP family protein refolding chaperone